MLFKERETTSGNFPRIDTAADLNLQSLQNIRYLPIAPISYKIFKNKTKALLAWSWYFVSKNKHWYGTVTTPSI
jgi:hypothetical protein